MTLSPEIKKLLAEIDAWRDRKEELREHPERATTEDVRRILGEQESIARLLPVASFMQNPATIGGLDNACRQVEWLHARLMGTRTELNEVADFNQYAPIVKFFDAVHMVNIPDELRPAYQELMDNFKVLSQAHERLWRVSSCIAWLDHYVTCLLDEVRRVVDSAREATGELPRPEVR